MKRAFTGGIILDGTENMVPQSGKAILVGDGVITGIVPGSGIPEGYERVSINGKYFLAGLINLHVHLAGSGKTK